MGIKSDKENGQNINKMEVKILNKLTIPSPGPTISLWTVTRIARYHPTNHPFYISAAEGARRACKGLFRERNERRPKHLFLIFLTG